MAISLVGTAGAMATGTTSVSPAWGTNQNRTANNLLTCVARSQSGNAIPVPSGWTQVNGADVVANQVRVSIFWKLAAGSDAAPTFSDGGALRMDAELNEWTGNDTVSPFDTFGTFTGTSGSSWTVTSNANASTTGGLGLTAWGFQLGASGGITWTPGTSWVDAADNGGSNTSRHFATDYLLSPTINTTASETPSSSTAAVQVAGEIAVFKTPAVAATAAVVTRQPQRIRTAKRVPVALFRPSTNPTPILVFGPIRRPAPLRARSRWIVPMQNPPGTPPLRTQGIARQATRKPQRPQWIVPAPSAAVVQGTKPVVSQGIPRRNLTRAPKQQVIVPPLYTGSGVAPIFALVGVRRRNLVRPGSRWLPAQPYNSGGIAARVARGTRRINLTRPRAIMIIAPVPLPTQSVPNPGPNPRPACPVGFRWWKSPSRGDFH